MEGSTASGWYYNDENLYVSLGFAKDLSRIWLMNETVTTIDFYEVKE